jgi:carbonic anhydrase
MAIFHFDYRDNEKLVPDWGDLGHENAVCSAGSQQSPLDIVGAVKSDLGHCD